MLDFKTFGIIIKNAPLISLDICLVYEEKILLCQRKNEPLKGQWFTPGGRIYKNETWQYALLRIVQTELGLCGLSVENFSLMGIWDHFYNNSAIDQNISTHYVNLPHYSHLPSKPKINLDGQHGKCNWFSLSGVSNGEKFHPYMRDYASWILNKLENTND